MKSLGNNRKGTLPGFIRYIRGEMTKREENNFQRYLQKDPFAEEASEGFSQISPDELENDLDLLVKKLKRRVAGKQRYIYYRIAASVAVLMIISSVYIISTRTKTERKLSETAVSETPLEIPATDGMKEKSENIYKESGIIMAEQDIEESSPESIAEKSGEEVIDESREVAVTGGIGDQANKEADKNVIDRAEIQAKAFEPPVTQKKAAVTQVSGKIIPEEGKMPATPSDLAVKGISSRVALDTGYILEMIAADSTGQTNYLPPVPLNGKENFDKYIEENIRIPDIMPEDQVVVVELDLLVKSTGSIDTIKVASSPGNEFSEEAIRLIEEGPEWKPAIENGRTINDEVKIKIVFFKNNDDEHLPE